MKMICCALLAASSLFFGMPVAAQPNGVLQSAETMDEGTFKLMAAPLMVFGKNGADDEFGLALRGGYGFTDRFDAEAKLGFFENGTFVGADGEFWVLQSAEEGNGLDGSISGGIHWNFGKENFLDTMGFEVTPQVSGSVGEKLELCGALAASFESIQDAPEGFDDSRTIMHLVPGFEYGVSDTVDLVGEVGVGLNDDSFTYAGIGIAFYLR